jgi:hypothetical protein
MLGQRALYEELTVSEEVLGCTPAASNLLIISLCVRLGYLISCSLVWRR